MKSRWYNFGVTAILLACCMAVVPGDAAQQGHEDAMAQAWGLLGSGRLKEALKAFEKLAQATGDDEEALLGIATAQYRLDNPKKSLAVARRLLETTQDRSIEIGALHLLGASLYLVKPKRKENFEEAERALRREIELMEPPDSPLGPSYILASVLEELGRTAEAIEVLHVLLAEVQEPTNPTVDAARILNCRLRGSVEATVDTASDTPMAPEEAKGSIVAPVQLSTEPPENLKLADGSVILQAVIDEEGCVTQPKIVKSLDAKADHEALRSIRGWTFRPATWKGKPVAVYYNLTINFGTARRSR